MTIKGKIVCLLSTYEAYAHTYSDVNERIKFNYDGAIWDICKDDLEKIEKIIKDLEVLEILNENIPNLHYIYSSKDYEKYKIICEKHEVDIDVYEEDYNKIKEWLDEKNV